jgi:hypothetical protein
MINFGFLKAKERRKDRLEINTVLLGCQSTD